MIKAEQTAPYFKNQNPVENHIDVVKQHTDAIMDVTEAPLKDSLYACAMWFD